MFFILSFLLKGLRLKITIHFENSYKFAVNILKFDVLPHIQYLTSLGYLLTFVLKINDNYVLTCLN